MERLRDRHREKMHISNRDRGRQTDTQRGKEMERLRDRHTQRKCTFPTETEADKQREREIERLRDRHTHTQKMHISNSTKVSRAVLEPSVRLSPAKPVSAIQILPHTRRFP